MWHEARRQERKIRGMLVDYRRRAERRRDFYEKIKADPTQFLQIHGRQCKIHLDPAVAAAADSAVMMPWQGQNDNLIDRFDVRAHLDYIPSVKKAEEPELNQEERQLNYERYRIIAQNAFLGIPEEKFLKQLHLEEQFGYTETKMKKDPPRTGGAAIGFNYEEGTVVSGPAPFPESENDENSDDNSDSDLDVDLAINVSKMDSAQAHEMNKHGQNFGMSSNDFYSFLTNDLEEAETYRLAKEEEHEKALFSGRKSRRERRAHREKRLANRVISPPSYAAKTSPTPKLRESKSASRSPSPEVPEKIVYITSFGGEEEGPSSSSKPTYADKVKHGKPRAKIGSVPSNSAHGKRSRSRSRSRDRNTRRKYRSRSRSRSYSRSKSRHESQNRKSRSTSHNLKRRSRSRSKNRYRKSRSRSRHRPSYHYRRYSRSSSHSSSSSSSSASTNAANLMGKVSRSRSPVRRSPMRQSPSLKKESPPKVLPRYYGRKKNDESSSDISESDAGEEDAKPNSVSNELKTGYGNNNSGTAIKKTFGSMSIQERLKRKRQALLNKQFKADKIAEQLKTEREKQEQQTREDELREMAIKLRRRQREKRHAYDSNRSSSSGSNSSKSGSLSPVNDKSRSPSLRRHRSRERSSRDYKRDCSRDRSRDRKRRDYSRDRNRRGRSRSRDRRSRDRRDRSRDKDRERHRRGRSSSPYAKDRDRNDRRDNRCRDSKDSRYKEDRSGRGLVDY